MPRKILVITTRCPYPLTHGTSIRAFQMIEYLSSFYDVHLLYMTNVLNHDVDRVMSKYCKKIIPFKINTFQAFWNVLTGFIVNKNPLQVNYFFFLKIKKWIYKNINNYDAVFCHLIRTAEYVKNISNIEKIIDYCDAISMNYKRSIKNRKGIMRYLYKIESNRCLDYERKLLKHFDKFIMISDIDRQYILDNYTACKDIHIIENSSENEKKCYVEQTDEKIIIFVGTMNYEPNITAVKYFLTEIFPKLKCEYSDIVFYVIGNRPPKEIQNYHNGVDVIVTGFVGDVNKYIKNSSIVVVPVQSGSGIQNKILEAMSMRGCVVTTTLGISGMHPVKEELFVSDTKDKMIADIIFLLKNKKKRIETGLLAEKYIKKHYSKKNIFEKFRRYIASES